MRSTPHVRPSPAMIIAALALTFALAGTAIAGPGSFSRALTKSTVKKVATKQATKQINLREPGLNVNSSKTADAAKTADTAKSAETAKNADTATTAGTAAPTGAAGGALTGTYPNPGLEADTVGAREWKGVTAVVGTGVPVAANTSAEASVTCPAGTQLVSIGFEWNDDTNGTSIIYASPTFVGDANTTAVVRGRSTGGPNTLFAEASCMAQ